MRLAALGSAALILFAPALSSGQGYTPYFSRTDFFQVAFPGQPAIQETTFTSEYTGVFPARVYSVANERGKFLVTVVDYTNAESIHKERMKACPPDAQSECIGSDDAPGAGSWRYDILSALDHATRPFLTREGKVTHFAWAVVDRVPGRQIHVTNPDGSRTFVAIHMHEDRLYILDATVPPRAPEPGLFQQSLQFLDKEGKPIRYDSVYVVGRPAPGRLR
jgi:hypothetical protein